MIKKVLIFTTCHLLLLLVTSLPFVVLLNRSVRELDQMDTEIQRRSDDLTQRDTENKQLQNQLIELESNILNEQYFHEVLLEKDAEIEKLKHQLQTVQQSLDDKKEELKRIKEEKQPAILHEKIEPPVSLKDERKVFLTFDDGPTTLTPTILETLKEHQVKATFFTIGSRMELHPTIVQQTYKDGHMVLPHSYSHDYSIYTSFDTFYDDFYKAEEVYRSILGKYSPKIFRFPGGSSNHSSFQYGGEQFMPELTADIRQKGYYYIDWNITSGDAGPDAGNVDKLLENIVRQSNNQDFIVVLFHDTQPNTATAEILPDVIQYYKNHGYTFRTFKDITDEELQMMVDKKIANKQIKR